MIKFDDLIKIPLQINKVLDDKFLPRELCGAWFFAADRFGPIKLVILEKLREYEE